MSYILHVETIEEEIVVDSRFETRQAAQMRLFELDDLYNAGYLERYWLTDAAGTVLPVEALLDDGEMVLDNPPQRDDFYHVDLDEIPF